MSSTLPSNPAPTDSIESARLCPSCGYNLFGLAENRCPECGSAFNEPLLAVSSMIPWSRRKSLGLRRAYLQTARLATYFPARLARAIDYPVRWPDAQRFRQLTVLLAFLPIAVAMTWWWWRLPKDTLGRVYSNQNPDHPLVLGFFVAPVSFALTLLAVLLFLYLASGTPRHFFYSKGLSPERQSRAVALSYYAIAPMLFAWVPLIALLLAGWFRSRYGFDGVNTRDNFAKWNDAFDEYHEIAILTGAIFLLACLRTTLVLLRRAIDAGPARLLLAAIALPVIWAFLAIGLFVGIHFTSGFLFAVLTSLT